ncbi:MAG: proteasome assembly chaperone family protein [Candidatus Heimdallarchaeota archaeon]
MVITHKYNNVRLVEEECVQFGTEDTPGTLFVGFAGPGQIGPIAVDMLFRFLSCREIGRIRCANMEPIVLFEDGLMKHPNLLLASESNEFAGIMFSRPPPPGAYYCLSDFIVNWAEEHRVSQIITLASFHAPLPSEHVLVVAEKENYAQVLRHGGKPFDTGIIEGFQAALLEASLLDYKIDASVLAIETNHDIPDPTAAKKLVDMFASITGLEIPADDEMDFWEKYKDAVAIILGSREE